MTEAEKEFEKINSKFFDFEDIHYDKIKKGVMQAYLDGHEAGQVKKTVNCNDCSAFGICPTKPKIEDYDNENDYLCDLETGVWNCNTTVQMLYAQMERMKCCGNCKHYVDDNCDLQCPHNCYNKDEWEMKA